MAQRDSYLSNLSGIIDGSFGFTQDALGDSSGLPNMASEDMECPYDLNSTDDMYFHADLANDLSIDPAMQAFDDPFHPFPQPGLSGQLPYDGHLEQSHIAMTYDGIDSYEADPGWREDSNDDVLEIQDPVDDSPVQNSPPKSSSRLNKNFKSVQYDEECLVLHNDILGHGPMADESWPVSVRRGAKNWSKLNAMYYRDEKKCTTSADDVTFPVDEAEEDQYAQQLYNALVDWTDYKEKKPDIEDLDEAQLGILGQTLTPYKTECLAYLLLEAAVKSQRGELLFAPWSTTNDYWESYDTFADRLQHMCQSLRASKQLVKSLVADGVTWANRIASRPKKEIKSKAGNKKLNDGKKDKMKNLERRANA